MNRVKAFIGYSNSMDDIYENIAEENPNKKCKMLMPFDDMIPDMLCNKKIHPIVIEVLYRVQSHTQKKMTITQKLVRLKNKIPDSNHSKYITTIGHKRDKF